MIISAYIGEGRFNGLRKGDKKILTHVNFSFAVVKDGIGSVDHWTNGEKIREFMENRGHIKAILSVGGWGAGGFSDACATEDGREKLAQSLVDIMNDYGFDGIDLDWEYPGIGDAGIDYSPNDKKTYTAWVKLIREKIGNTKLLTMAAGAFQGCIDNLEIDELTELLDYFNIMTYDMSHKSHSCHHTSLFASDLSQSMNGDKAVRLYEAAGIPLDKLVFGAAFYARIYSGTQGLNTPYDGEIPAWSGGYADTMAKAALADEILYDEKAEAAYAYDSNNHTLISFDNPRSLKAKCDYARERGMLGIMFWEYTCDDEHSTLLNAMK